VVERPSRRAAFDSQPIPRFSSHATSRAEQAKYKRIVNLSDAALTVKWLNAAKAMKANASYERVVSIHQKLRELREKRTRLQEFSPDPKQWNAACRDLDEQHKRLKAGLKAKSVTFPGDRNRDTAEGEEQYQSLIGEIEDLACSVNKSLSRYAFRPCVTYFRPPGSMGVIQHLWTGGMLPDANSRWFQMTINDRIVSEGDAALFLVRLDLTGNLSQVLLCKKCKERWHAPSKRSYKFCSPECREGFYASPEYQPIKANSQKTHRASDGYQKFQAPSKR